MLKIESLNFEDLSDTEKEDAPNNGAGKKDASYIRVTHDSRLVCIESDAMEPEDAVFYRDLSWITRVLEECYKCGKIDGYRSLIQMHRIIVRQEGTKTEIKCFSCLAWIPVELRRVTLIKTEIKCPNCGSRWGISNKGG